MRKAKRGYFLNNLVVILIILLSLSSGNNVFAEVNVGKQLVNPKDFVVEETTVYPAIPGHSLPLAISIVTNFEDFSGKIPLSSTAIELLQKNAFVVIPTPLNIGEQEIYLPPSWEATNPKDDFVAYYKALKNIDVPIFITSDSLLHYYHIFLIPR